MEWLNENEEIKAKNDGIYGLKLYTKLNGKLNKNRTASPQVFANINVDSCLILASVLNKFGGRALVGKVCLDSMRLTKHENLMKCLDAGYILSIYATYKVSKFL